MTEQLLDGLVSPTESPEKSPPQSLPKGFVLASNLSPDNISVGDGYLSEDDEPKLISMPVQGQSNDTCNHTGHFSWMGAFSAGTT